MTHTKEQAVSITESLLALASANRLKYIDHDVYETEKGKRLIITELGFVEPTNLNYKLKYLEVCDVNKELKSKVDALVAERATLCGQNKELSGKTLLGARKILDSKGKSDAEIIKELKKYLVI